MCPFSSYDNKYIIEVRFLSKQFVPQWLLTLLNDGPYRDEREVRAEQREIRKNGRAEVDRIWEEQARKLAPPPAAPLPPPAWGAPPPPSFQETPVSAPGGNPPFVETPAPAAPPWDAAAPPDPGIGPVSRLAEPIAPAADYWGRPPGKVETIP